MPETLTPEGIASSIANVGDVYRYAKGKQVLPLQDPQLGKEYEDVIGKYFGFCQTVLTDPDILTFIGKSDVGKYNRDGKISTLTGNNVFGARQISGNVYLLTEGQPRLVFCTEYQVASESKEEDEEKWKNEKEGTFASKEGLNDWVFGRIIDRNKLWFHGVYDYRTMGASDLLFPHVLRDFVDGIGRTFSYLINDAVVETAKRFDDVTHVDRVREIINGFSVANAELARLLTSKTSQS